ncbi:retropepsin-like aspartic protease family protein [Hyphomicrobium sp.]|uniref:retropepsin-like aspartic protease family protein n=1 Tax=Hyphomicrobium sp. TaxID=82 RepID=UPI002D7A0885|nr:TIGR02281 family clan AA aspartic protease [Hyphomicrobium sp.]HET6390846.1 TIGR02281 family clan AA aspartic protease [Hyphomicrobium sp.]
MLAFLLTIILGLGALLAATMFGGLKLDDVPDLPVAAAVIAILVALYFATLLNHRGERRLALWPTLAACISGAILVAGAFNKGTPFMLADFLPEAKASLDAEAQIRRDLPASVRIRRNDDGTFLANSEINGQAMTVRIDTGSATVVLRQSDAERAGIDVSHLDFDTPLKTANGTTYLAPVRLKSVRVGPLVIDDVEAMVARPGTLNENLLGTSFLRRLASYQVSGNFATLRR